MALTVGGGGKRKGLLPPRRVSAVYDSHVQASTQGGTTARILAFAAGLGLVACSLVLWLHWIVDRRFSWMEFCVSITAFFVGIFAFVCESNLTFFRGARVAVTEAKPFLLQVSGRGAMYAATGLLQCLVFGPLHLLVGLYTAVLGVYMIKVGRKATDSLATLKTSITDEKALLKAYHAHDRNGDGVLEAFEFDGLLLSLGIELDSDELEAAFTFIDKNDDKKIVYDEFQLWWKACTAEAHDTVL